MGGPREREREHLGHYSDLLQAMFHGPKSKSSICWTLYKDNLMLDHQGFGMERMPCLALGLINNFFYLG